MLVIIKINSSNSFETSFTAISSQKFHVYNLIEFENLKITNLFFPSRNFIFSNNYDEDKYLTFFYI